MAEIQNPPVASSPPPPPPTAAPPPPPSASPDQAQVPAASPQEANQRASYYGQALQDVERLRNPGGLTAPAKPPPPTPQDIPDDVRSKLYSQNPADVRAAFDKLRELAAQGNPQALEMASRQAYDHPELAKQVIETFAGASQKYQFGDAQYQALLNASQDDKLKEPAEHALAAAIRDNQPGALDSVRKSLADRSGITRQRAAEFMGRVADKLGADDIKSLEAAYRGDDSMLKEAAGNTLAKMRGLPGHETEGVDKRFTLVPKEALLSKDQKIRHAAAMDLSARAAGGDQNAIGIAVSSLTDPLTPDEAKPGLMHVLEAAQKDHKLGYADYQALAKFSFDSLGDKQGQQMFAKWAEAGDEQAMHQMRAIAKEQMKESYLPQTALNTLSHAGSHLSADDMRVFAEAASKQITGDYQQVLEKRLKQGDPEARAALRSIIDQPAAGDEHPNWYAAEWLGKAGAKMSAEDVKSLEHMAASNNKDSRGCAAQALLASVQANPRADNPALAALDRVMTAEQSKPQDQQEGQVLYGPRGALVGLFQNSKDAKFKSAIADQVIKADLDPYWRKEALASLQSRARSGDARAASDYKSAVEHDGQATNDYANKLSRDGYGNQATSTLVESANTRLQAANVDNKLTAADRGTKVADLAAEMLANGQGEAAAQFLDQQAKELSQHTDGKDGAINRVLADNFSKRAAAYRAKYAQASFDSGKALNQAGYDGIKEADALRRAGRGKEADQLEAMCKDSIMQSRLTYAAGENTNAMVGESISKVYRDIVNKSFDQTEPGAVHNFIFGDRATHAADKAKMNLVFDELDRTMKEQHMSFDQAWISMMDDHRVLRNDSPLAKFGTRSEAAMFLRDHEVTKGLLMPFSDMSRCISQGDSGGAEKARGDVIRTLRENRQWDIANGMLEEYKASAATAQGKADAQGLADSKSSTYWKQRAGDFATHDLPVMVLAGILTGGIGDLAAGGAEALELGTTAVNVTRFAAEVGAFVPTDRVLNDAINNKPGDWSAGAMARDYALTAGGMGLFKAIGKGWEAYRAAPRASEAAGEALSRAMAGDGDTLSKIITENGEQPKFREALRANIHGRLAGANPEELAKLQALAEQSGLMKDPAFRAEMERALQRGSKPPEPTPSNAEPAPAAGAPGPTPESVRGSSPMNIPESAKAEVQAKNGYTQIRFRWQEGGYNYEARWHTPTPGAPEGQGNTWVVNRTTPGTSGGAMKKVEMLLGENEWIPQWKWQAAVKAHQGGTATVEQEAILQRGHHAAP